MLVDEQRDEQNLEQGLLDETYVEEIIPLNNTADMGGNQEPATWLYTTFAFLMTTGSALPPGLIASITLEQVIQFFTALCDLKPVEDETARAMLNYANSLEMSQQDANDFSVTRADYMVQNELYRTPMVRDYEMMIGMFVLAATAFVCIGLWLCTRKRKTLSLSHPIETTDQISVRTDEFVSQVENPVAVPQKVHRVYVGMYSYVGDKNVWSYRFLTSLSQYLEPVKYGMIIPVYIVYAMAYYMTTQDQHYSIQGYDDEFAVQYAASNTYQCGDAFPLPSNKNSEFLQANCYFTSYKTGGAYGRQAWLDSLELTPPVGLAIASLVALVVAVGISACSKPVYAQLKVAARNQWNFLVSAAAALKVVPLGYKMFPGKALYQGIVDLFYLIAITPASQGGGGLAPDSFEARTVSTSAGQAYFNAFMKGDDHALATSQEYYNEYFFRGSPTTWTYAIVAAILLLGAVDFIFRLMHTVWLNGDKTINREDPMTKEEQDIWLADPENKAQIAINNKNGRPHFLYETYRILMLDNNEKAVWSYKTYLNLSNFVYNRPFGPTSKIPSLAELYIPVAIGVVLTLTVGAGLDIQDKRQLHHWFLDYFKVARDAMSNCISADQQTNCNALAANQADNLAFRDYMAGLDSNTVKVLYGLTLAVALVPVGATALVFTSALVPKRNAAVPSTYTPLPGDDTLNPVRVNSDDRVSLNNSATLFRDVEESEERTRLVADLNAV